MTAEQRKKDQELRKEMWHIRETQNKNVCIKKGEIVEVSWTVSKKRPVRQTPNSEYKEKPTSNGTSAASTTADDS